MKIVHISAGFLGTGTSQKEEVLIAAQRDAGHQVTVVGSALPHSWANLQIGHSEGNRINTALHDISIIRLPILFHYATLRWCKDVAKTVAGLEADIWHLHEPPSGLPAQVIPFIKNRGPIVVDQHQYMVAFSPRWWVELEYALIRRHIVQRVYNAHPAIVSPTAGGEGFLVKHHGVNPGSVTVIPLLADITRFYPDESERTALRQKLGIGDGEMMIIVTGQVQEFKRHDELIRGFALAVKQHAHMRLVIVGTGAQSYTDRLHALAKELRVDEKILWLPFVKENELRGYFNAADLAVWALFPTVSISQALVCGCPVLLSTHPSQRQYLDVGLGRGYTPHDLPGMANEFISVATQSPEMRKKERSETLRRALAELSPSVVVEKYQRVYEQAAHDYSGRSVKR